MRRSPAWVVSIGMLLGWVLAPGSVRAADGFWVTLAAGVAGSNTATSSNEFWFDTPHGPPLVGVNQLSVGSNVQAVTGGGNVFFSGAGTPVLLGTTDGSAYISTANAPKSAQVASSKGVAPASAQPVAGGSLPSSAALLGVSLADPDAAGVRSLTAALTDSSGKSLGTSSVGVPDGGWWVIGLTPGAGNTPDPDPGTGGGDDGTGNSGGNGGNGGNPDPNPPVDPIPNPGGGGGGPVATPEPTTFMLVGIGGMSLGVWRRFGRKAAL